MEIQQSQQDNQNNPINQKDTSIQAIANKWIVMIMILSAFVIVGGYFWGYVFTTTIEILPFAVGVIAMMVMNIISVLWLKKVVENAIDMEANTAGNYMRLHKLLRFLAIGAILTIAVLAPDSIISLPGALTSVFTLPVAMRLLYFFI